MCKIDRKSKLYFLKFKGKTRKNALCFNSSAFFRLKLRLPADLWKFKLMLKS